MDASEKNGRFVAELLKELSEDNPGLLYQNISVLVSHVDSEVWLRHPHLLTPISSLSAGSMEHGCTAE